VRREHEALMARYDDEFTRIVSQLELEPELGAAEGAESAAVR
jgi:hypothetical protein